MLDLKLLTTFREVAMRRSFNEAASVSSASAASANRERDVDEEGLRPPARRARAGPLATTQPQAAVDNVAPPRRPRRRIVEPARNLDGTTAAVRVDDLDSPPASDCEQPAVSRPARRPLTVGCPRFAPWRSAFDGDHVDRDRCGVAPGEHSIEREPRSVRRPPRARALPFERRRAARPSVTPSGDDRDDCEDQGDPPHARDGRPGC